MLKATLLCAAMAAAALQAAAPAFQALHAVEHAAHDARFAAEFGDLTHDAFRATVPLHQHEPGEDSAAHCASCKVQARLATIVHAAPTLVSDEHECGSLPTLVPASAPRGATLSPAAPRAPPTLLS